MRILFTILTSMMITAMSFGQGFVISQYIETNTGSTPKGIEIYNNTGATINFTPANALTVHQGTNGAALGSALVTVSTGSLANQAVMVIGTADIGTYLSANGLGSVLFITQAFTFNGDDALQIRLNGVPQDTFGNPGSDPGTSWPAPSGGSPSTANQNIAILCSAITAGAPVTGWTNPNVRFETIDAPVGTSPVVALTGFGVAPDCAPPACTATIAFNSATCDAVTSGTDTYTSTFDFLIGTETGSLNVSSNFGTPSPTTISADGTITVTGVNEGQDVIVTVSDGAACSLQATAIASTCVPVPPSVEFVSATSSGSEGGSTVDICLAITDPSSEFATSVDVVFDDVFSGAASPGDFTTSPAFTAGGFGPTVTLTWPISDATQKCITVTIVDDAAIEGDETADFFLDNLSAGAGFGSTTFHSMTISDNDGPQPCPSVPVWEVVTLDDNPAVNDGNNGEWTAVGPTGYTANGFCGGSCQDITETWLVYGPLDASSATALSLTMDATESFGVTDLNVQYATDYGTNPCPSLATWTSAGIVTGSGIGLSFDMTSVAGNAGIYIGIQYYDDGVDGYSDWVLDNFVIVSDACPVIGTPVTSSCVVCTTTLVASGAVCDAQTSGTDTYTATFTYDATTELNDLAVTVIGGTSATTTVTAGTSGTIAVSGTEGADVTVGLNNALCTLSATENSPVCVPVPVPSCAAGETSLVFDSFEGGAAASAVNPAAYDSNNDTWIHLSSMGSIAGANEGVDFWAMQDLDNVVGGGAFDHELVYNLTFTPGDYSSLNVSFYYYTSGFNSTDHLGYKYTSGSDPQVVVGQGQLESLSQNTAAWTQVTLSIPVDGAATSAQFILYGFQNGGDQYGGFDDLNICGSTAVACTATLLLNSVSCDAYTAAIDTYTATFDYDASFETEDLTVTVVPAPQSQSAITITAGTGPGQFTVTMPETTSSYTVSVSNSACSIQETVTGVTCEPLPQLVINEVDYDQPEANDPGEFIELYNAGAVGLDLSNFEVKLWNGSNSTVYNTFALAAVTLAPGDYYVLGNASVPNVDEVVLPNNSLQNGAPDGVELLYLGIQIDAMTYEGTIAGITETAGAPTDNGAESGSGLSRTPNGTDTNDNSADFIISCITPGAANVICANNEDCADAISITPSVFGIPNWEVFQLGGSESLPGCAGDAGDDIWFKFVANSANDIIIAQDPVAGYDVVVELFSACGGTSLGCFNNYGAGSIERALAGNLTEGAEYYFRVYDAATGASASTSVQVMVKTFEDGQLYGASCGATGMSLPQVIYAERDELGQLYTNPGVGVIGYGFRFQEQGGPLDVVVQQPVTDGFYLQLSNVPGLQYGKTYDVTVQHRVVLPANGILDAYWSDFGTTCTVSLGAAPTAQLKPQYCAAATDYYLADQIQSVYVAGANRYRFTFSGSSTFVKESTNYGVFLYSVGSAGNGLQYGNSYSVTVEARINGVWTLPGAACTIFMQGQPEDTNLKPEFCGGTYVLSNSNYLFAIQVLGASKYEFKFSPTLGGTALTQVNNSLSFAFHLTSLPFLAGTSYSVQVRAFAGGVWGDYATACDIAVVAPPTIGTGNNTAAEKAITSDNYFSMYPNPNDGAEFIVAANQKNSIESNVSVEIMDITGKMVYSGVIPVKGSSQFKVTPDTALNTGMYLLRLSQNGESQVLKFIVR
jgi:hypothetical protein